MAKQKLQTKPQARQLRPPRTAGEAVIFEALDKITPQTSHAYVTGCFAPEPEKMTEKQKTAFLNSLFSFAAVGWAFYCWTKYEDDPIEAAAKAKQKP